MRKSTFFSGFFLILALLFAGTFILSQIKNSEPPENVTASSVWITNLGLTDPALFTEASYIRHLSQADRHAPFQDHPTAMEHFPGGALILPPAHLKP